MLALSFTAMGCQMQALCQPLTNIPPLAVAKSHLETIALEKIPARFAQAECRFSRFLPESELMRLNQHRTLNVSDEFWQLLKHSMASARLTDGIISPTLLQPLLDKGYQESFQPIFPHKSQQPFNQPSQKVSQKTLQHPPLQRHAWQDIKITNSPETDVKTVTLPDTISLDMGGFAKGLTALACTELLGEIPCCALIDAGGDIVTVGVPDMPTVPHNAWRVELPNVAKMALPLELLQDIPPFSITKLSALSTWQAVKSCEKSRPITLALPYQQSFTLATSGIDYRFWYHNGKVCHHLVHPDMPSTSTSDIVCASVLIEHSQNFTKPAITQFLQDSHVCNLAQTLSKLFCLLGVEKSLAWLEHHGLNDIGIAWIVVTQAQNQKAGKPQYQQWLNPVMSQYSLQE